MELVQCLDGYNNAKYNLSMDVKVYKKEEVRQKQGTDYVITPNVIDIIPTIVEATSTGDIKNNIWSLEQLKTVADVDVVDGKLIINSDKVKYENGNLYVTLTEEQIIGCEIIEEDNDIIEQACALATIWQKGLDPLDREVGIRWSEALLDEINVVQLMEDITNAVAEITPTVTVVFDTVTDANGNQYLKYTLKAVA